MRPFARGRGCGRACRRRGRRGEPAPRTTASAYAVLINVPGAQSSGTLTSPAGSYQYRDLVAIHAYTAGSALSGSERAYGHSDLTGISLLGGAVTADSILSRTYADGRKAPATGSFGGTVTGLVVAGAAVSVQPGGQFAIPGIGWGAVDERRVVRSDGAYRGSEVALHIHLTSDWHNLPAGTEILLGYADAAASAHPGGQTAVANAPASPASTAPVARGGASDTNPGLLGAPVVPVPASDGTPTDSGDGLTPTGIEAPPPGGFTLTPPIDPAVYQQLTSPGYVFPVAGGAHYGHDFGNFRADTGFHEGSDLFAPAGTPLVAVQSGVLHNVGWNRLGGWRLWVEDTHGNWFYYAHLSAYSPIARNDAPRQRGRRDRLRRQHGRRRRAGRRTCTSRSTRAASGPCRRMTTCRPGRATATRSPRSPASRRPSRRRSSAPPTSPPPPDSRPRRCWPSRAAPPSTPAWWRSASRRRRRRSCWPRRPRHDAAGRTRRARAGARARLPREAAHARGLRGARRALGRGHGAAADRCASASSATRPLRTLTEQASQRAEDGTIKLQLRTHDGYPLEAVAMSHGPRRTVCLSSQSGCALACTFCATGRMGLGRNLTPEEISEQLLRLARLLRDEQDARISNVVMMGMGEPFHNYDNVLAAIRTINAPEAFGLGARQIAISTAGWIPGIDKLAEEPLQVKLALSLHAPDDELRTKLMPVTKRYPIAELMEACRRYRERTRRRVFIEYLLLAGVNDSSQQARQLVGAAAAAAARARSTST